MATVSLGGTLEEKIEAIAQAGFDGIELLDDDLRRSGMSAEECESRCADRGLTIDLYQPFRRAEGVPRQEFGAVLSRFRREIEVMRRLGAESILVVSNTDPDAAESRDLSAAQLSALGTMASEYGISVMFEALAWGTRISRVADARDVLQRADHPNLSLVVDTFHLLAGGEDAGVLDGLCHEAVGFVQVADAPWLPMDLLQWSRNHRRFPGEGDLDLAGATAAALSSGYDGPLSLEIFNPGYRERPPQEVARRGFDALRRLIDQVQNAAAPGTADHIGSARPVRPARIGASR